MAALNRTRIQSLVLLLILYLGLRMILPLLGRLRMISYSTGVDIYAIKGVISGLLAGGFYVYKVDKELMNTKTLLWISLFVIFGILVQIFDVLQLILRGKAFPIG